MNWDLEPRAEAVLGNEGPWGRHLALAWRACAEPALAGALPPEPTPDRPGEMSGDLVAYWGPLLHLLIFGLGWQRPDLGLARWTQMGRPTDDPVLNIVNRWYGKKIDDFLAWTAVSTDVQLLGERLAQEGPYRLVSTERVVDLFPERRSASDWTAVWGEGDPLHLTLHALSPITYPTERSLDARHHTQPPNDGPERMTIVLGQYLAWYATLWHYHPELGADGRSIRTDVFVKPIGWMGEFRHSRETGAWFRGRHRWHVLGF